MASGTATIRQMAIFAVKKTPQDFSALGEPTATSSSTFTSAVNLSFTVDGTAEYLILASCSVTKDETGTNTETKLTDGTTDYGLAQHRVTTAEVDDGAPDGELLPWGIIAKASLTGAQSWDIMFRSITSGSSVIRIPTIIAMRTDLFRRIYYSESLGTSTNATGLFQDKVTLTDIPAAFNHVIISNSHITNNTATNSTKARVLQDATTILEAQNEPAVLNSVVQNPVFTVSRKTLSSVSTTWKTQWARATALGTTTISNSNIAVLQLEDSATVWIKGANILGATIL